MYLRKCIDLLQEERQEKQSRDPVNRVIGLKGRGPRLGGAFWPTDRRHRTRRCRTGCASVFQEDDLFPICLREIPSLTFSPHMTGVQKNSLAAFTGCATMNTKSSSLPSVPSNASSSCVPSPYLQPPAIIQTMEDCMSQGADIQLEIFQNSSLPHHQLPHHSRQTCQTTRKRACFRSVLPLLFLDGWSGMVWPAFVSQAAWI